MTATIPTWQTLALCRTEGQLEDFFPETPAMAARAKAVCARCEVEARCGASAIERGEEWGVFGGLDRDDRIALGMVIPDPWHGTPAGVKAHRCDCQPCKTAHARDVAAWRSKRRWAATDRGLLYVVRELDVPRGRGKRRAFEKQLYLEVAA